MRAALEGGSALPARATVRAGMEVGYRKSVSEHPFNRQLFSPIETEGSTPEFNPVLLLIAALVIYAWSVVLGCIQP